MKTNFCYHCKKRKPTLEFDEIIMNGEKCLRGWCKKCSSAYKTMQQKVIAYILRI